MKYKLYEVGGKIRDEFLGIKSKDIDYSVVLSDTKLSAGLAFVKFRNQIEKEGYEIFLSTPEVFTIRAKFPVFHEHSGVADFVIARKEVGYIEGTRQPNVVLGTLLDDLTRRDFTVNCIAKSSDGRIVDPFNGQNDISDMILRTPTDAFVSFNNDPLRILRGMRFMITKGFAFSDQVIEAIRLFEAEKMTVVSDERIREELFKMFKHNTKETLKLLRWIEAVNPQLYAKIFDGDIWLEPTNKN